MHNTNKFRAICVEHLVTSLKLEKKYPTPIHISEHVAASRRRIEQILIGKDKRLLVIIGPCSIHDFDATIEYAYHLLDLRKRYKSYLEVIMRTYFEKPRTVTGWKGLIIDPNLDGSCKINLGIEMARRLLLQLNELGMPTATEFLNIATGQFIIDLISWGAIGARTTESQMHRELASALSCPIGFKNNTDSNTRVAINAIRAARTSHVFLSPDDNGKMTIYQTSGNPYGHIVMRGGTTPNYYTYNVTSVCNMLHKFNLPKYLIIDCSHGNCQKQFHKQLDVCDNICKQIKDGSTAIVGVMVESFLKEGMQNVNDTNHSKVYGQSITDPCLGLEDSKILLRKLSLAVESRF